MAVVMFYLAMIKMKTRFDSFDNALVLSDACTEQNMMERLDGQPIRLTDRQTDK